MAQFELALREYNIPYFGIDEDDFLNQLEIQDVLALLTYLIQPYNDLAIAQILHSPCFGIGNEELIKIALIDAESWHEKIKQFQDCSPNSITAQAIEKIDKWKKLANTIPVHDLLDKIFFEINIFERYKKSCSPFKQAQVVSNLTQLLHLSLDINAGRYSNIHTFLNALHKPSFKNNLTNYLNFSNNNKDAIQIMTIHSAKGLEAPVIFLIDTATSPPTKKAYQPIINWSQNAQRPDQFFIIGRKDNVDQKTKLALKQQMDREWTEELNLLYVALTRAKQYLFVSGVKPTQSDHRNWYSVIKNAIKNESQLSVSGARVYTYGKAPLIKKSPPLKQPKKFNHTYDLSKPLKTFTQRETPIKQQNKINPDLASHGTLVHKLFELILTKRIQDPLSLKINSEIALTKSFEEKEFEAAMEEVNACLENSDIKALFKQESGKIILSEIPVAVAHDNKVHYQIIDCLILSKNMNWIIDFKTTSNITIETMNKKVAEYKKQISNYVAAVNILFPNKKIRASILFTAIAAIYDFDINELN